MYRWVFCRLTMAGFVCIYYGNTGSSWLLSALNASPAIYVPGFEPIEDWAWDVSAGERLEWLETMLSPPADRTGPEYRDWLEAVHRSPQVREDPQDARFVHTGLKMNDLAVNNVDEVIGVIERTGAKVIVLSRNNRLKHALSMYRYHDEAKSQFDVRDEYAPTRVRFHRFGRWLRESERLHRQGVSMGDECERRLGPDRVVRLAYEDFADDPGKRTVLDRLAAFLDVEPDFGPGEFRKVTPDSLVSAIANYRSFRLRYRLTRYASDLD